MRPKAENKLDRTRLFPLRSWTQICRSQHQARLRCSELFNPLVFLRFSRGPPTKFEFFPIRRELNPPPSATRAAATAATESHL
jgi:hypothetical protein